MTETAPDNLLFHWGPPRARARALAWFIVGSILLHAFCFYLFQIVYPPAVTLAPPPARVTLISNMSDDGRSLLRWVDAEDPALVAATLRPSNSRTRELPRLQHVPSYEMEQAQLRPLPPMTMDLSPPSPQPPGPVPIVHHLAPAPPVKAPTTMSFSEEIAGLGNPAIPPAKFVASTREQPENARFRIAVNAQGEVEYAFPINSSGDTALDNQARHHLALIRFPHQAGQPNESLKWGLATVEWGADVARASPSPAAAPSASPSP